MICAAAYAYKPIERVLYFFTALQHNRKATGEIRSFCFCVQYSTVTHTYIYTSQYSTPQPETKIAPFEYIESASRCSIFQKRCGHNRINASTTGILFCHSFHWIKHLLHTKESLRGLRAIDQPSNVTALTDK